MPQYFRHNRFQSLVRQLNFYSFRKVNRERNVWIYKHELFHRDRPEDLHLVRRRTCPGMDGRKHRFPRFPSRRFSETGSDNLDADDSSIDSNEDTKQQEKARKKREASDAPKVSLSKRSRILWHDDSKKDVVVETSLVEPVKEVVEPEDAEDQMSLATSKNTKTDLAEHEMVVSRVAQKLEQYARKAKGRTGTRNLRSGVVTPPHGSTPFTSVLTYDDERHYDSDDEFIGNLDFTPGYIYDGDESLVSEEASSVSEPNTITPTKEKVTTPIVDFSSARAITDRMLDSVPAEHREALVATATVASFCMSTAPTTGKELCSKILQLIASCEILSAEFQLYRSALHPMNVANSPSFAPSSSSMMAFRRPPVTVQQIWEREASRGDAVRDFKTFAVNCVQKILDNTQVLSALTQNDKDVLVRTANVWLKSECIGV